MPFDGFALKRTMSRNAYIKENNCQNPNINDKTPMALNILLSSLINIKPAIVNSRIKMQVDKINPWKMG